MDITNFLRSSANEVQFTWDMGGSTYVARADSLIGVNFPGNMSGSDKNSKVPVVNLEVGRFMYLAQIL